MADYNLVKLWDLMDKELGRMEAPFTSLRYGDFFVKAIDFEVRIEYQGLMLDVDKNDPEKINPISKTTFGELYKRTIEREEIIKSAGYNLIVKWGD